jgi:dolichol-phosphate mannosyltransferase
VAVDDNSPDGTAEIVANRADERRVVLLRRPAKLGLGSAHLAGFERAVSGGFDPILSMDADFSHHPRDVPALLRLSREHDVVIGSRYVPGGGTRNCSLGRRVLSRTANEVARHALGLRAADCTAGFRCYRRAVVESLLDMHIVANGYSFLVEVLFRAQRLGYTVAEVPILFVDRALGTSKISKQEVWRAVATVFRLTAQRPWSRRAQPTR